MKSVFDFTVKGKAGEDVSLSEYEGKVLLIVNTATKCGYTPQYKGLEALYEKYHEKGFEILDFPCNQFLFQAPGNAEKIDSFCTLKYNTQFPRFAKIKVNGDDADPLFKHLKAQKPNDDGTEKIKWNFNKFLINRNGEVIARFVSADKPEDIAKDIEKIL